MKCEVEFGDVFFSWWQTLSEKQQNDMAVGANAV